MEVLDASSLADRLKWESKEYWLHLEAASPWEKYPGAMNNIPRYFAAELTSPSKATCKESARKVGVGRRPYLPARSASEKQ